MFCVMIEGQEDVGFEQWRALADACEHLGFEGLFTSDHYGSALDVVGRGALDVWGVLCAVAARTSRIRLGTMVSPVTYRLPAVIAKLALTADHVSAGRIELGLGAGWHEGEHRAFGIPFPTLGTRIDLLAEQCEIVTRLLAGEELDFAGAHYQLERCRLLPEPVQRRLPLILGGGARPRTAALAARFADEYNLVDVDPDECRAARGRLAAACEAVGRDPATLRTSLMARCVIGRDRADFERRLERSCARAGEDPGAALARDGRTWIAGTADEVRARIDTYRAAGIERFYLQHLDHADLGALELLASTLIR